MATKLKALLRSGELITSEQYPSIDHMPVEDITQLVVESEEPGVPPVTILVDLDAGERVHRFTRVIKTLNPEMAELANLRVSVFEIKSAGKTLCRLYWHPVAGPILTTKDLYEF